MSISFICENINNELIEYITKECESHIKPNNAKIFVIASFEELDKVRKDRSKNKIIITSNISREFVTKALDVTENIIYKDMENSIIAERINQIFEKRSKYEN